ncbi:hypothetical protein SETIT_5G055500v2 [Setaria italica]|uniref:Uncharacterized protein n=1 Tax=Setaria italica TaxID=4555 RepID=A0A368R1I6_SETIT|nr:hypothetical protein SETIT_5G055500v2 [Setaria italica]
MMIRARSRQHPSTIPAAPSMQLTASFHDLNIDDDTVFNTDFLPLIN